MKRFITSLGASIALSLALLAPAVSADASHFWQLQMYKPTAASTAHTLNIEYTVLSTENTDTFDVNLFETQGSNTSQPVPSQHIDNNKGGNSGIFTVTLADGTYSFHVQGVNNSDSSTQTTADQTVTVTTASGGTQVVFVNNGTGGRGAGASSSTTTAAATGGQVLGTETTPGGSTTSGTTSGTGTTSGQINAPGSSKTKASNGKVLGVETTKSTGHTTAWAIAGGVALILLVLYYWLLQRRADSSK